MTDDLNAADLKAIAAQAAMDGQRVADRERDDLDVQRAMAEWIAAHPRSSSHYMRIVHFTNLGDTGGDWCCFAGCRDDLAGLAKLCGVDFDPETGHWRCQNHPFFEGVAIVTDPVPEVVYSVADKLARTGCRADCPVALARAERDAEWQDAVRALLGRHA